MKNQEQAKYFLPFVQAMAEGKTIQFKYKESSQWFDYTEQTEQEAFISGDMELDIRIKSEPKLRPWKPKEAVEKIGALLRVKGDEFGVTQILGVSDEGVNFINNGLRLVTDGFNYLLSECEHSLDHGKTWHPCGVLE